MNTNTKQPPAETCVNIIRKIAAELSLHRNHILVEQDSFDDLMINVQVHRADMGRLMGEKGVHKDAILAIAKRIGAKGRTNFNIQFLEPEIGEKDRFRGFQVVDPWDSTGVVTLFKELSNALLDYPSELKIRDGVKAEDIGKTRIDILTHPRESDETMEELNVKLAPLFKAIGLANGRRLTARFVPDPNSAALVETVQAGAQDWNPKTWAR